MAQTPGKACPMDLTEYFLLQINLMVLLNFKAKAKNKNKQKKSKKIQNTTKNTPKKFRLKFLSPLRKKFPTVT